VGDIPFVDIDTTKSPLFIKDENVKLTYTSILSTLFTKALYSLLS